MGNICSGMNHSLKTREVAEKAGGRVPPECCVLPRGGGKQGPTIAGYVNLHVNEEIRTLNSMMTTRP